MEVAGHAGHKHVILRQKLTFPSEHGGQAQVTENSCWNYVHSSLAYRFSATSIDTRAHHLEEINAPDSVLPLSALLVLFLIHLYILLCNCFPLVAVTISSTSKICPSRSHRSISVSLTNASTFAALIACNGESTPWWSPERFTGTGCAPSYAAC